MSEYQSTGLKTSEFKAATVVALLAGYVAQTEADPRIRLAAVVGVIAITVAYIVSRGLAKQPATPSLPALPAKPTEPRPPAAPQL